MSGEATKTEAERRALLESYLDRGFKLIPYPPKQKGPSGAAAVDWPKKPIEKKEDLNPELNHGVLLGTEIAPGRYLVDIDFDWTEGIALGKRILAPTSLASGRGDKPVTHAFYTTDTPIPSKAYTDVSGKTLVEIRATKKDGKIGNQTMLPPSIHPNGEEIALRLDGDIAHVSDIDRQVSLYAITCILYYHLGPKGLTHEVRLALGGFLLSEGMEEAEVILIGESLCEATGNDVSDVKLTVQSTAARVRAREKVKGKTVLTAALGDSGKQVLAKLREWMGGGAWTTDSKTGAISPNDEGNIRTALERLGVRLAYDRFAERELVSVGDEAPSQFTDKRRNRIYLDILKHCGFRPSQDFFDIVTGAIAFENSFHPVIGYLDALVWDGEPRLDAWLVTFGGAKDTAYTRAVSALPLIAAVRRVRNQSGHGVKFDELLVLESEQGLNKSSALRTLCPDSNWFSDDLPLNVEAKQVIERTVGKWIIEAGELAGLRRSVVEQLKSSLSRQCDGPVRQAYERKSTERPRQFIVIGTTNSNRYLKDSTGNRRFWPIKVGKFDIDGLVAARDQLWAEAAHREKQGESIRLNPSLYAAAAKQQEHRREEDPWEDVLTERLSLETSPCIPVNCIWDVLGTSASNRDNRHATRVAEIMQRYGFKFKKKVRLRTKDSPTEPMWCWLKSEASDGLFEMPRLESDDDSEM